jgi:phosphatidylinositol alpha-1,6-mannosyltransferase
VGSLSEGLGLMALEASASGVPTVGPNMPGLNEAIINGVTGVLVKPQSSDDLASATLKLIDDPILREKYSENGKKFVNDKFDSEKLIDKLLSLIEKDYDYYYINNLR